MNKLLKCCSIAAILASTSAFAEAPRIAAGVNVGLPGIGLEARTPVADNLYARLGVNYFNYKHSNNDGKIKYDLDLNLTTAPLMLDYHPFDNSGFRVSAGVAYNNNYLSLKSTPSAPVTLYGRTYSAAEIGHIKGKLKLGRNVAPILSIGYDSSLMYDSAWSFNAELGVMYAGKPKLDVSTSSKVISQARQAQLKSDIEADSKKQFAKDAQKYLKYYPMISVGVKYNF